MPRKLTYEYIKSYIENLGYILVSTEYVRNNMPLHILDKDGYYYAISFTNLQQGNVPKKFCKSNSHTIQNIKLWCKLNDKPFKLISGEYVDIKSKLKWECLKENCGEIFISSCDVIYHNNNGCPYCAGQKVGLSNCLAAKNPELAKEWHPFLNDNLTPYDVTANSPKEIWWQCRNNPKHEWKAIISNRNSRNSGCPNCCHNPKPSKGYNLLICNPTLCEEWDYDKNKRTPDNYSPNAVEKVWWKCNECNNSWLAAPHKRNNGRGCPSCSESKGEKKISKWFSDNKIFFNSQFIFNDCRGIKKPLRFDFAVFKDAEKTKLWFLIEYDGKFHYEPIINNKKLKRQQRNDQRKDDYCNNNNIKLLRIPYWDFDNIEEILYKAI